MFLHIRWELHFISLIASEVERLRAFISNLNVTRAHLLPFLRVRFFFYILNMNPGVNSGFKIMAR